MRFSLLNPWFLLGVFGTIASIALFAYLEGRSDANKRQLEEELNARQQLLEQIQSANDSENDLLACLSIPTYGVSVIYDFNERECTELERSDRRIPTGN